MKIAVLFAEGFEEVEAVSIVDVLRRAEFEVVTVGVAGDEVRGDHDLVIRMDMTLASAVAGSFDAVVLPGGGPGAIALRDSPAVIALLQETAIAGKPVAAICAAPIALQKAGLLKQKKYTCYPGFDKQCPDGIHTGERVQVDGKLITGKGPGAALEFAIELVRQFGKPTLADKLHAGMLIK